MIARLSFVVVAVLSLYVTAFAGAGCSSVCSAPSQSIAAGSYVMNPTGYTDNPNPQNWRADNYLLTLSADRRTVDESFDLDGKHYHLTYAAAIAVH